MLNAVYFSNSCLNLNDAHDLPRPPPRDGGARGKRQHRVPGDEEPATPNHFAARLGVLEYRNEKHDHSGRSHASL